jgi:hypothetical protein
MTVAHWMTLWTQSEGSQEPEKAVQVLIRTKKEGASGRHTLSPKEFRRAAEIPHGKDQELAAKAAEK